MRTINVTFEDSEFKKLETVKDRAGLNWHDLMMTLTEKDETKEE